MTILPLAPPSYLQPVESRRLPPAKDEATLTVEVQGNTPPGEYTLTVLGQAQVPYARMRRRRRRNVLVSLPARPVTVVVPAKK